MLRLREGDGAAHLEGRGENAAENHIGKSHSQHPPGERNKWSQSHEAKTWARGSVSSFSYLFL